MQADHYLTRDHTIIRDWADLRGARPAAVAKTRSPENPGVIRLDVSDFSGAGYLERITWEEWLRKFDEGELVLLFQETSQDGAISRFHRLVPRRTAEVLAQGGATWVGDRAREFTG